jgi:hypothetical protein
LGAFIVKLKEQIPDFEEYILTEEQEAIDRMIVDYFDQFSLESHQGNSRENPIKVQFIN